MLGRSCKGVPPSIVLAGKQPGRGTPSTLLAGRQRGKWRSLLVGDNANEVRAATCHEVAIIPGTRIHEAGDWEGARLAMGVSEESAIRGLERGRLRIRQTVEFRAVPARGAPAAAVCSVGAWAARGGGCSARAWAARGGGAPARAAVRQGRWRRPVGHSHLFARGDREITIGRNCERVRGDSRERCSPRVE